MLWSLGSGDLLGADRTDYSVNFSMCLKSNFGPTNFADFDYAGWDGDSGDAEGSALCSFTIAAVLNF